LRDGRAKVMLRTPFVIKMLVPTGETSQEVIAGMDTGSRVIGCAAITRGEVVYQSEVKMRVDVSKKMRRRAMYRRTRRGRKCRYRPARWLNRASMRKEGRIAPSIQSKIDSHLREKNFVESILPVSRWVVETASFDIHKITNPAVCGKEYQEGAMKGYYNVKAYVLHRDGHKCQSGQKGKHCRKLRVHHLVPRKLGGTDEPGNLLTLCETCHDRLHRGEFVLPGKRSRTKHATEMGFIKAQLRKQFGPFTETFGYETKFRREQLLRLPKSHINDAVAICCEGGLPASYCDVMYLKRHVASGDYQQTKGIRSERRIPTGKLFGLRKFDLVQTVKGTGFVKGKRSSGFFAVSDLRGNVISPSVDVRNNCRRLAARKTTLIETMSTPLLPRLKPRVSVA